MLMFILSTHIKLKCLRTYHSNIFVEKKGKFYLEFAEHKREMRKYTLSYLCTLYGRQNRQSTFWCTLDQQRAHLELYSNLPFNC